MSKRKSKDKDSSDDEELDWLSGSYTTILDKGYEAEFGDIFGEDEEDDNEIWDADDFIMMADDDEDEDY
jgi:hypothetical protein